MTNTNRDTQFSGYAKLLLEDLKPDLTVLFLALGNKDEKDIAWAESFVQATIAQHAYDLVSYTINLVPQFMVALPDAQDINEVIAVIPDLTKWPERPSEESNP